MLWLKLQFRRGYLEFRLNFQRTRIRSNPTKQTAAWIDSRDIKIAFWWPNLGLDYVASYWGATRNHKQLGLKNVNDGGSIVGANINWVTVFRECIEGKIIVRKEISIVPW